MLPTLVDCPKSITSVDLSSRAKDINVAQLTQVIDLFAEESWRSVYAGEREGHDEGWRHYTVVFSKHGLGIVVMTNCSNGEGIYKELLETVMRNTFTPIEWERFTPYDRLPPRTPRPE